MSSDVLLTERDGAIAVLTLNRPQTKNALSTELLQATRDALDAAAKDPDVRVIILTGAGGAFCSGADLKAAIQENATFFEQIGSTIDVYHAIIRGIIGAP